MPTYSYTAREKVSGRLIKDTIEAENEQAAIKTLQKDDLLPIEIKPGKTISGSLADRFNKVRTKDKVLFSRQLSTLINAGLPLVQSLHNVAEQTKNKHLNGVISQVVVDVEGGMALSAAMGKHPEIFDRVYVSLVAAGEASGTLDTALERLAEQQEKDAELLSKVRSAMVYPAIVLVVMVVVVGFMIIKVLPQVKVMYQGIQGAELPIITRVLLAISDFGVKYWWVLLIALAVAAVFATRFARTAGGKRLVDRAKLDMWPIASLFRRMYMARFARTGATLVASGVPLIQVLEITSESVNNVYVEDAIRRSAEKVRGGKALSDSLALEEHVVPSLVPNMIHIGEQSGSLEGMLGKVADYYEKEVDTQVKTISTVIEPALMVLLGIVAFIIVAAVLLPVYNLSGKSFIQ